MATIYELSEVDSLANGDFFPIYSLLNGDARKASALTVAGFMGNAAGNRLTTQYEAPSATGFSVSVTTQTQLNLTPDAGYAAGEIVMPSSPADRDEVLVNCTQSVTTLTINPNGKTVVGGPSTLAANAFFRLKYDAVMSTWYRVG